MSESIKEIDKGITRSWYTILGIIVAIVIVATVNYANGYNFYNEGVKENGITFNTDYDDLNMLERAGYESSKKKLQAVLPEMDSYIISPSDN